MAPVHLEVRLGVAIYTSSLKTPPRPRHHPDRVYCCSKIVVRFCYGIPSRLFECT